MARGRDASAIGCGDFRRLCRRYAHVSEGEMDDAALRQLFAELALPHTPQSTMAQRLAAFISESRPSQTDMYISRLIASG